MRPGVFLRGGREHFCQRPIMTLIASSHSLWWSTWLSGLFQGRRAYTSVHWNWNVGAAWRVCVGLTDHFQTVHSGGSVMLFLYLPSGTALQAGKHRIMWDISTTQQFIRECEHRTSGGLLQLPQLWPSWTVQTTLELFSYISQEEGDSSGGIGTEEAPAPSQVQPEAPRIRKDRQFRCLWQDWGLEVTCP